MINISIKYFADPNERSCILNTNQISLTKTAITKNQVRSDWDKKSKVKLDLMNSFMNINFRSISSADLFLSKNLKYFFEAI